MKTLLLLALSIATASANHVRIGSGHNYSWEYRCADIASLTSVYFTPSASEVDSNRTQLLRECALLVIVDDPLDDIQDLVDVSFELTDPSPAVYFRQLPPVYCDGFAPPIVGCITAD